MREKQGRKEKGEDMSVKIDNVTVRFQKDVKVLDDISFTIPSGVYGLLGENGAGKTTLMGVLATLLKPSAGDVMINNMVYRERGMQTKSGSISENDQFGGTSEKENETSVRWYEVESWPDPGTFK